MITVDNNGKNFEYKTTTIYPLNENGKKYVIKTNDSENSSIEIAVYTSEFDMHNAIIYFNFSFNNILEGYINGDMVSTTTTAVTSFCVEGERGGTPQTCLVYTPLSQQSNPDGPSTTVNTYTLRCTTEPYHFNGAIDDYYICTISCYMPNGGYSVWAGYNYEITLDSITIHDYSE